MNEKRKLFSIGRPAYFKGKQHSLETKSKMSKCRKGKPNKSSTKFKIGNIPPFSGKQIPIETRLKMSLVRKGKFIGAKHPRWIHDRSKLLKRNKRNDSACMEWKKQVHLRDSWSCRIADINCEGRLEAHHILPWRDYPELRYETNNGITLCHAHHPRKRSEEAKLSPYFQKLVAEIQ